ncbi:MAG: hypothetical protein QF535_10260, partial [Anaerolineales bacterium]|nr:hypothetical protein [Anaerolineales bacterium]
YDVDANTIKKYINGSLDFTYSSVPVSTDGDYSPSFGDFGGSATATINVNFGQDSSFAGLKTAQGNQDSNGIGDFYYEPPTDYLALCTSNLPSPEIALPTDHFDTQLWTGTGSGQTFSDFTFQPDFLWFKQRNGTSSHALFDSVRGVNAGLDSGSTAAENTVANASQDLVSFDDDGFTTGTVSQYGSLGGNTNTIVTWSWKAGGTASSNTDGTITSSVSANTDAGFSIVKFDLSSQTGAETIGHGLSQAPEMIVIKSRERGTYNWSVYQKDIGNTKRLILNDSAATSTFSEAWNDTSPTSSVFSIGDAVWHGADEQIAYCFHSVEGYSKVGSYTGNGAGGAPNSDGPFVYTNFRPEFVL